MVKKLKAWLLAGVMMLIGIGVPMVGVVANTEMVWAATNCGENEEGCVDTNILDGKQGIDGLLKLIVNILLYGLGAAATLGVVIAGILYLTARDNPQQVARAKARLIEISIGLAAWAMLAMILKFLIPGFKID